MSEKRPSDPDYEPPQTPEEIEAQIRRDKEEIENRARNQPDEPDKAAAAAAGGGFEDLKFDYKTRLFYSVGGNSYVMRHRGVDNIEKFLDINKGSIGYHLRANGCSTRVPKKSPMSVADAVMEYVETYNRIAGSGSVAGFQPGIYDFPEGSYAVTSGFTLPEPGAPDPRLGEIIRHMFLDDADAYDVFLGWCRRFYVSLRDGTDAPGQILALLGPPGTGKTWLINCVIARLFGGRISNPFTWLSGESRFNDDVVGAELQVVDDEQAPGDRRTRKSIASKIKKMIGSAQLRVEGKGKKPVTVCPRWRLVFGANDEAGAMNVFPEGTSDMKGKVCFIEVPENPVYTFPGETMPRPEFDALVDAAFPGFVREVVDHVLPAHLADPRWGVVALKTAAAVVEMDEKDAVYNRTDDERLGDMLAVMVGASAEKSFSGSATEIIAALASCAATRDSAGHVLNGCPRRTGRLLAKLADKIAAGERAPGVGDDDDQAVETLTRRIKGDGTREWTYMRGEVGY